MPACCRHLFGCGYAAAWGRISSCDTDFIGITGRSPAFCASGCESRTGAAGFPERKVNKMFSLSKTSKTMWH